MINFIDHWQTLVGAMVGAASAFFVWMLAESYRAISERKERLFFVEKTVGMEALIVADTYKAIDDFLKTRFAVLLREATLQSRSESYFVGTAFFPLFSYQPLDADMLRLHSGSGYVDSKFLAIVKRSRDFADTVADIKRQFESTINNNRELALLSKNSASAQNLQFVSDLISFEKVIRAEILENNVPLYIKEIVQAQVSLKELQSTYLWIWKLKFGASFKYFKNKKCYLDFISDTHGRIDSYFKDKFKNRFDRINTEFNPRLKEL